MHPSTTANYIDKKLAYCWPYSKTILSSVQSGTHGPSGLKSADQNNGKIQKIELTSLYQNEISDRRDGSVYS